MKMPRSIRLQLTVLSATCFVVTLFNNPVFSKEPLKFVRLPVESPYRLEKSFKPKPYFGVIRSQKEFEGLWDHLVHADDEGFITLHAPPEIPEVDFSKYAVFWFADNGAQASFTELKLLEPDAGGLKAHLEVGHSDFGSRRLNVWKIPASKGPVNIEEKHIYDRGP